MSMKIAQLYSLVEAVRASRGFVQEGAYSPLAETTETTNEYTLFLKPELTAVAPEVFAQAAQLIDQHLHDFGQQVVMPAALEPAYIRPHRTAHHHYAVINQL